LVAYKELVPDCYKKALKETLSKEVAKLLKSVSGKRARVVIEHILKHGHITTEDLEKTYNYNHPPRAARDVREAGIPLETFRVKSSDGRQIAAYKFGDLSQIKKEKLAGRSVLPKELKDTLYDINGGECAICYGEFEPRYLQVDHKIPYEVSGEPKKTRRNVKDYMLLCGSCNRAKSWSCEHCPNWLTEKLPKICSNCYWASPEDYTHIALREVRRTDILWDSNEIQVYEKLKEVARNKKYKIPNYIKKIITERLRKNMGK
jgi:hypothetical protein